jgi:anti-sigma regulatory factor (Ser/Thr protein kinase)
MCEWDLRAVAEVVELVVSELVTNAIVASRRLNGIPGRVGLPSVHLRLSSDRVRVLVEVWDANPNIPSPRAAGLNEESGRGLMLVEALSTRWSWYATQGSGGKVVWAEIAR